MNYLAHLHIADWCGGSLPGNFLGDFVKGNPKQHYQQQDILQGIKLHRFIDSYVDRHEIIRQAKTLFPEDLVRFAPIALDVFWDHCLASNWSQYHESSLAQFCKHAEHEFSAISNISTPKQFSLTAKMMWQNRWLESYQHLENINYVLDRISKRRVKLSPLKHCFSTLEEKQKQLFSMFDVMYPQLLSAAKQFSDESTQELNGPSKKG